MTGPLFPENYSKVWIRGRFITMAGVAVRGKLTMAPTVTGGGLVNRSLKLIMSSASFSADTDNDGYVALQVPATNDPDITPINFTYAVTTPIGQKFSIVVPYDTPVLNSVGDPLHGQPVIELIDMVPVGSSGGVGQLLRGIGIQSIVDNGAGSLLITYTDGATSTVVMPDTVAGPAGPVGPLGPIGPTGPAGPIGPAGTGVLISGAPVDVLDIDPTPITAFDLEQPALGKLHAGLAARQQIPCRVVFAGSSTPAGVGATVESARFVNRLVAAMQAAYPSGIYVEPAVVPVDGSAPSTLPGVHGHNVAWGGATSANYLSSDDVTRIAALNPRMVLHMVGSNDYQAGNTPATCKANVLAQVTALKAAIPGPCVQLIVHAHRRADVTTPAYPWAAYGAALAEIAVGDRDNVAFLDVSRPYELADAQGADPLGLLNADQVHNDDPGHELMAELIRKGIGIPDGRPQFHVVRDTFTRPDNATALVAAETGQAWTSSTTWTVTGGKAATAVAGNAFVETGLADVDATLAVTYNGATAGVLVRAAGDGDRLGLYLEANGNVSIFKSDAGAATVLTNASFVATTGQVYVLRAVAKGNVITGYVNGVRRVTYTLTTAEQTKYGAYTKAGLRVSAASPGTLFDNFVVKAA